ncbi:MAG: hypothetical protein AB7J40_04265 [Candidatus Altimarinota bacterium]
MKTLSAINTPEIQMTEPVQPVFDAQPLQEMLKQAENAVREKGVMNVETAIFSITWQVLAELQSRYAEITNSAWYHILIGSNPDGRHRGCDQDAEAYEEAKRIFTELPQMIERGDFNDILQGFLARQKITGVLSKGRI